MATLLYRKGLTPSEEVEAIQRHFPAHDHNLVGIRDALVVGRYSVLPHYAEVEEGLRRQGSRLINSQADHDYVAGFGYYWDLEGMTPKTWFRLSDAPRSEAPFVLKGRTNSKKHAWDTSMYAATFEDAVRVQRELQNDMWLGEQEILVRKFVPLRVLETGVRGLPFANEWRFFFLGEELIAQGFYWSGCSVPGEMTEEGIAFARSAARLLKDQVNFFTVDIAETATGEWIVIEVNDGQMAGLSEIEPDLFYRNLAAALERWKGLPSSPAPHS